MREHFLHLMVTIIGGRNKTRRYLLSFLFPFFILMLLHSRLTEKRMKGKRKQEREIEARDGRKWIYWSYGLIHECDRVFVDRVFVDHDLAAFEGQLSTSYYLCPSNTLRSFPFSLLDSSPFPRLESHDTGMSEQTKGKGKRQAFLSTVSLTYIPNPNIQLKNDWGLIGGKWRESCVYEGMD